MSLSIVPCRSIELRTMDKRGDADVWTVIIGGFGSSGSYMSAFAAGLHDCAGGRRVTVHHTLRHGLGADAEVASVIRCLPPPDR
jgi:hypothetical protein